MLNLQITWNNKKGLKMYKVVNVNNMNSQEFSSTLCNLYYTCNEINLDNVHVYKDSYKGFITYK